MSLGDFNANVGREDILKPTTGNKSLHKINNDNGVRLVHFAASKNITDKSTAFPHHKTNLLQRLLTEKPKIRLTIF
jgi:hypothetical protein